MIHRQNVPPPGSCRTRTSSLSASQLFEPAIQVAFSRPSSIQTIIFKSTLVRKDMNTASCQAHVSSIKVDPLLILCSSLVSKHACATSRCYLLSPFMLFSPCYGLSPSRPMVHKTTSYIRPKCSLLSMLPSRCFRIFVVAINSISLGPPTCRPSI